MKPELSAQTPYDNLSPELVLAMVERLGLRCTGGLFAMNSYENRVYDVALEDTDNIIIKVYRPHRWTKEQILEEHAFAAELQADDVPVVPPQRFNGQTLHAHAGYLYALYPKRGGRAVEMHTPEDFKMIGRLAARIHNIGSREVFHHRGVLNVRTYGWDNLVYLRGSGMIPRDLMTAYDATVTHLLKRLDEIWAGRRHVLRLHGDCHLGNILVNQGEMFMVDLDDCLSGPAVQDLWMMANGDRHDMSRQFGWMLEGYTQFRDFDYSELQLVEPLRALRMIHYTAWLARRWNDPTFPKNFPFFAGNGYWEGHINALKEQLSAIDEPLLVQV
jgi:Ser/Thr protein kinase RdoA (MazF antagonist)